MAFEVDPSKEKANALVPLPSSEPPVMLLQRVQNLERAVGAVLRRLPSYQQANISATIFGPAHLVRSDAAVKGSTSSVNYSLTRLEERFWRKFGRHLTAADAPYFEPAKKRSKIVRVVK
jgi:hypothetical protein